MHGYDIVAYVKCLCFWVEMSFSEGVDEHTDTTQTDKTKTQCIIWGRGRKRKKQ